MAGPMVMRVHQTHSSLESRIASCVDACRKQEVQKAGTAAVMIRILIHSTHTQTAADAARRRAAAARDAPCNAPPRPTATARSWWLRYHSRPAGTRAASGFLSSRSAATPPAQRRGGPIPGSPKEGQRRRSPYRNPEPPQKSGREHEPRPMPRPEQRTKGEVRGESKATGVS